MAPVVLLTSVYANISIGYIYIGEASSTHLICIMQNPRAQLVIVYVVSVLHITASRWGCPNSCLPHRSIYLPIKVGPNNTIKMPSQVLSQRADSRKKSATVKGGGGEGGGGIEPLREYF